MLDLSHFLELARKLTINGRNFSGAAGHLTVFFGSAASISVTYVSDSQITAVAPTGTGTVDVRVQSGVKETDPNNPKDNVKAPVFGYGKSAISTADRFTYSATGSGLRSAAIVANPAVSSGGGDVLTVGVEHASGDAASGPGTSAFTFSPFAGSSPGTFGAATAGTYPTSLAGAEGGTVSRVIANFGGVTSSSKPTLKVKAAALHGWCSAWPFAVPPAAVEDGDSAEDGGLWARDLDSGGRRYGPW
jgi:hypothetical protein